MRDGSIGSWVHGAISPSCGGDEDGDLTSAISNSLRLHVCEAFLFLFLSLHVSGNDLKVKQKLKIFSGSNGLFYSQSKWFSGKFYFHAQPNTQFHVKGFIEIVFSQNKHNLNNLPFQENSLSLSLSQQHCKWIDLYINSLDSTREKKLFIFVNLKNESSKLDYNMSQIYNVFMNKLISVWLDLSI